MLNSLVQDLCSLELQQYKEPNALSGLGVEFINIFEYFILRGSLCTGVEFHI